MTKSQKSKNAAAAAATEKPGVRMEAEVARRIRQHGRSSMKAEVCGVLIGSEQGRTTVVEACIAGVNAAQGGAHVTFTQDAWEHIYKVKDQKYPNERIVGWYHSHPGFGVFLSDHDMFIHENFFSSPQQIAWVYDPHSDEEGCFGWQNKKIEKLDDIAFQFVAPRGDAKNDPEIDLEDSEEVRGPGEEGESGPRKGSWIDIVFTSLTYIVAFVLGAGAMYWFDAPALAELAAIRQLVERAQALQHMQQQMQQMSPDMGSGPITIVPPGAQSQDGTAGQTKEHTGNQSKGGSDGSKR